jgi:hypothetical protein
LIYKEKIYCIKLRKVYSDKHLSPARWIFPFQGRDSHSCSPMAKTPGGEFSSLEKISGGEFSVFENPGWIFRYFPKNLSPSKNPGVRILPPGELAHVYH